METSNNCEYDSLEIYNGETRQSANQVAKLCGSGLPDPIVSSGPHLFLRFHSDFSVAFKGFKLEFTKSGMAFGTKPSVIFLQSIGQDFSEICPILTDGADGMVIETRPGKTVDYTKLVCSIVITR